MFIDNYSIPNTHENVRTLIFKFKIYIVTLFRSKVFRTI